MNDEGVLRFPRKQLRSWNSPVLWNIEDRRWNSSLEVQGTTISYILVYEPPFFEQEFIVIQKEFHHFLNGGWLAGSF